MLHHLLEHYLEQLSRIWLQRDEHKHVSDPSVLHAPHILPMEYLQNEARVHIQAILDSFAWRRAHRLRQLSFRGVIVAS